MIKRKRKIYADDSEKKARRMEAYKKEKEINQRRKEENLSLASKGLDCNGEKVDLFQIPEEIKDINNKETPIIITKDGDFFAACRDVTVK